MIRFVGRASNATHGALRVQLLSYRVPRRRQQCIRPTSQLCEFLPRHLDALRYPDLIPKVLRRRARYCGGGFQRRRQGIPSVPAGRKPSDNLRFSKPRKHRPCIRNRRSSDGGGERGRPRHRLQRHHGIADRVHGARADIHDRIRGSIDERDPEPRSVRQTVPPIRHLAQRQFPSRERQRLRIAGRVQVRAVQDQQREERYGKGRSDVRVDAASD